MLRLKSKKAFGIKIIGNKKKIFNAQTVVPMKNDAINKPKMRPK